MADGSWREHLASIRPDANPAEVDWWDTSWASGESTPVAVGFLIPRGFEAYARVLHPATDRDGNDVTWAEVAGQCGTVLHPQAQWSRVAGGADLDPHGRGPDPVRWRGHEPNTGCLERPQFGALADVLGHHTQTPDRTIVAFWVGYGVWPHAWSSLPTSPGPVRESHLFQRALLDVPTLCAEAPADGWWQSPSAWWPADHAWATTNDVDLDSTLVGGSHALIDALLADERLEALPWPTDGSLWAGADTVNR